MRLPKQSTQVDREMTIQVSEAGAVAPAGWLDTLKGIGINALKGALGGVAGSL